MKRGTPSHPKTLALARTLDVDVAQAMGILEMLCNHFAPAYCPQGDIGKWSDQEIAEGLQTTLPAERLVSALVRARWLDEHPKHRLVIHDWAVHSDRGVKNRLRSWGVEFVGSDRGPTRVRRRSDRGRLGTGSGTGLDPSGSGSSSGSSSGSGARRVPSSNGSGDGFPGFWVAYPKKRGKLAAEKEWRRLQPDATMQQAMARALEWQHRQPEWLKEGGRFIPHPATWLHQRRWEDEPVALPYVNETDVANALAAETARRRHRREGLLE